MSAPRHPRHRSRVRRILRRIAVGLALVSGGLAAHPLVGVLSAQAVTDGAARPTGAADLPVTIHFLDVGQGDAAVIRGPDGRFVMIDAGRTSPLRELVRLDVRELALVVASHAHADHIGGLEDVLTARPVDSYMDNGRVHTTATYEELMAHVERIDLRYLEAVPRTISLGTVTLEVLPIPPDAADQNNASVGILLRYGEFGALFTGDAEREELNWWVEQGVLDDVAILKAAHHGAANGFTWPFLERVRPEVVVISVGADNRYDHPRPEALAAYGTLARHVLRTDRDGGVTVRGYLDGTWDVETEVAGASSGPDSIGARAGAAGPTPALEVEVHAHTDGGDRPDLNGEYVSVWNHGPGPQPIGLWRICDLSSRCFRFPPGSVIRPGRRVVVYTGYGSTDGVSFFMNNPRAVWNDNGDEATLFDAADNEVVRYVYE